MSEILCPLTHKPLIDPYILTDGFSYEKEAILDYIKSKKKTVLSPVTNEPIDPNYIVENVMLKTIMLFPEDYKCRISRETIKIPIVNSEGTGYDYDSFKQLVTENIKESETKFYMNCYREQEIIIPNKTLAKLKGINIDHMKTEYYDFPQCRKPTDKPIYDIEIRKLMKTYNPYKDRENLITHFKRLNIPIYEKKGYPGANLVIMNLDLSKLILQFKDCKGLVFYNCKFNHSTFMNFTIAYTQFNYCDLSNVEMRFVSILGTGSYYQTNMFNVHLVQLREIETWQVCFDQVIYESSNKLSDAMEMFKKGGGLNYVTITMS